MGDTDDDVQLVFRDGELVKREGNDPDLFDELSPSDIEPCANTGFTLQVKDDALVANESLTSDVDTHGRTLTFGSRAEAECYATGLSNGDADLQVQRAAPNDPADVDAYLLAAHDPSITEPVSTEDERWTFDVGANLYGDLGETIILDSQKQPALRYFVKRDLDHESEANGPLILDISREAVVSNEEVSETTQKKWVPDCVVTARERADGPPLEQYYCEIKTGNASFERSQSDVMKQVATEHRVLKIRVSIESLPEQYTVRIEEVQPQGE